MDKPDDRVVATQCAVCKGGEPIDNIYVQGSQMTNDAAARDRTASPVIGLMPENTPTGVYTIVVSPDYRITQSSHWNQDIVGTLVWDIPGAREALGADYVFAMETRNVHVARRFWDGGVWNNTYRPLADGSMWVDCECVLAFRPADKLTLNHFVEFANRVSASLSAVADPLPASPRSASTPRSVSPVRLSAVPDQP